MNNENELTSIDLFDYYPKVQPMNPVKPKDPNIIEFYGGKMQFKSLVARYKISFVIQIVGIILTVYYIWFHLKIKNSRSGVFF